MGSGRSATTLSSLARTSSVGAVHRHADRRAVPLGQQAAFDAVLAAVGRIWAGLSPPQAAPWSSRRPYSARPNRCRGVHQTARRRPATASGTRRLRPTRKSDRERLTWRTSRSQSARPIGRQSATRRRSHPHSGGQTHGAGRLQSGACSRGPAAVAPSPTTARPRSDNRSSSCCLGYERARASSVSLCSYSLEPVMHF